MPRLSIYSPDHPYTGDKADTDALIAWGRERDEDERGYWRDLISVLALGDLRSHRACCDDPECPVAEEVRAMHLRVWRMIPEWVLVREFGEEGTRALLKGE